MVGLIIFIAFCVLFVTGLVAMTCGQSIADELNAYELRKEEGENGSSSASFEPRQKPDKTTQG